MKEILKPKGYEVVATMLLLLISVVFVPAVSAIPADIKSDESDVIIGIEGVTQNKVPVTDAGIGILETEKVWYIETNIWRNMIDGMHVKQYSKSRDGESAWDIDKIAVRGRVWRKDEIIMDETVENEDSADAMIKKVCSHRTGRGDWKAQGDHTFEESGCESWYPTTVDTY